MPTCPIFPNFLSEFHSLLLPPQKARRANYRSTFYHIGKRKSTRARAMHRDFPPFSLIYSPLPRRAVAPPNCVDLFSISPRNFNLSFLRSVRLFVALKDASNRLFVNTPETGTHWDKRGRGKAGVHIFDGAWGRKCSTRMQASELTFLPRPHCPGVIYPRIR